MIRRSIVAISLLAVWTMGVGHARAADTRLIDAVKSGHREAVRALLKARADVNAPEVDGTTALHWAVRADDLEMVRLLIAAGAKAAAANRYGVMPLSLAATNGNAVTIETLVAAGADPNSALPEGETVLMTAARTGSVPAIKALLDRGADVNAKERWQGETALMWAASENHAAAVALLAAHGASVNARSSALQFPKFAFNGSTMVSTPMPRGSMTALLMAARQGALDGVRALAEAGADLNLTDPDGSSALVLAIVNLHPDVAMLLLEKGADPNVVDSAGMAALYAAMEMRSAGRLINRPSRKPTGLVDSLDLVKRILDRGGNPNARLKTPTLQRYHNGGDVQLTDGATPLMRAAKSMDVSAMRLLLDKGADPSLMTKNLTTPLMFVAGAAGARNDADARDAMSLCLAHGADVNAFNSTGQTALHIAVEHSDAMVRLLVERGAEMDVRDRDGRTPLDIAMGVSASTFQGRRGAAPTVARESTAALLRQLSAQGSNGPALAEQDRDGIRQLVARYARALATCASKEYAELFTPDGEFTSDDFRGPKHRALYGKSATLVGRAKLVELVETEEFCMNPDTRAARQKNAGSTARPPADLVIEATREGARGSMPLGGGGRYVDIYVKTADGWRFKSRSVFMPPAVPQPPSAPSR